MNQKMSKFESMLNNMQEINHNMVGMKSQCYGRSAIPSILPASFGNQLSAFNSIPFL